MSNFFYNALRVLFILKNTNSTIVDYIIGGLSVGVIVNILFQPIINFYYIISVFLFILASSCLMYFSFIKKKFVITKTNPSYSKDLSAFYQLKDNKKINSLHIIFFVVVFLASLTGGISTLFSGKNIVDYENKQSINLYTKHSNQILLDNFVKKVDSMNTYQIANTTSCDSILIYHKKLQELNAENNQ